MVHALRQARRVVKHGGYLLDLRPAPIHRHVGIENGGSRQHLAVMKENFGDDYAANQAVKELVTAGELVMKRRIRFDCTRRMDRFHDFKVWLDEYVRLGKIRSQEFLLHSVQEMLKSLSGKARIVVRGPVDLRVLVKN